MRIPALAAALLLAGAGLAEAQTTHTVQLFSTTYSPKNITISVGDTVRWVWVTGFHDVQSGVPTQDQFGNWVGLPDGHFSSGALQLSGFYEVTFDYPFLAANPVANDLYRYYCTNHLPGMTGTVKVNAPTAPAVVEAYGSIAPADSLTVTAGEPRIGQQFTMQLQDTKDFSGGPGFGMAFFANAADPNYPAGTVLPGFGMGPGFDLGEILVSIAPPNPIVELGPKPWSGSFTVVEFFVNIPNDPSFAGAQIFAQGALLDPTAIELIGLSNGLRMQIGG